MSSYPQPNSAQWARAKLQLADNSLYSPLVESGRLVTFDDFITCTSLPTPKKGTKVQGGGAVKQAARAVVAAIKKNGGETKECFDIYRALCRSPAMAKALQVSGTRAPKTIGVKALQKKKLLLWTVVVNDCVPVIFPWALIKKSAMNASSCGSPMPKKKKTSTRANRVEAVGNHDAFMPGSPMLSPSSPSSSSVSSHGSDSSATSPHSGSDYDDYDVPLSPVSSFEAQSEAHHVDPDAHWFTPATVLPLSLSSLPSLVSLSSTVQHGVKRRYQAPDDISGNDDDKYVNQSKRSRTDDNEVDAAPLPLVSSSIWSYQAQNHDASSSSTIWAYQQPQVPNQVEEVQQVQVPTSPHALAGDIIADSHISVFPATPSPAGESENPFNVDFPLDDFESLLPLPSIAAAAAPVHQHVQNPAGFHMDLLSLPLHTSFLPSSNIDSMANFTYSSGL